MENKGIYYTSISGANIIRGVETKNCNSYLPRSLFSLDFFNKEDIETYQNKPYTNVLINVTFDDNYFEFLEDGTKNIIMKADKIREQLYTKGFIYNGEHYSRLGRNAGKARIGNIIFVKASYLDKANRILNFNLPINIGDRINLSQFESYKTLIMSESIGEFSIAPHEILLVEDIEGQEIKQIYNVTEEVEGELKTSYKEKSVRTCITDGSCLMDESIFNSNDVLKGHSFALLRNQFFKSAAFNVKLQQFFTDKGVETLTDMFGVTHKASDIKLIITPNSLKFLKYDYLFNSEQDCFNYWLKNKLSFGIVKCDKEGTSHCLTYQFLNSLPITENEVKELLVDEIVKINKINNDSSIFAEQIAGQSSLVGKLLAVNSDFQYTTIYKTMRKDFVQSLKNDILHGKINLGKRNAGYHVMICNPIEQLYHICGLELKHPHTGKEIYCSKYEDGKELTVFRNPHISASSIMVVKNKYHEDFKYLNLTKNIVIVNGWDEDICNRLSGCDFDSDTINIIDNDIILNASKRVDLPITFVDCQGSKIDYKYTNEDLATLDNAIHTDLIGRIVNQSQIANSLYNHYSSLGEEKHLEDIRNTIYMLDSLGQIAIDLAKKQYSINFNKVFNTLSKKPWYLRDNENKKILPMFFKKVVQGNYDRTFDYYNTPMDFVYKIIQEVKKAKRTKGVEFKDLLKKQKELEGIRNTANIKKVRDYFKEYNKKISFSITCKSKESRKKFISLARKELIESLKEININQKSLYTVVKGATSSQLLILYDVYKEKVIELFKSER